MSDSEQHQHAPISRVLDEHEIVVGKPAYFGTVPALIAGVAVWLAISITGGPTEALKYSWLLLIGAYLGPTTFLKRLRIRGSTLRVTVLGPWRQSANLESLESIRWKHTGGAASPGSMFVRDRSGRRVRIGLNEFDGVETWGPLLLEAAARSGATIDRPSRNHLDGSVTPRERRRRPVSPTGR